MQLDVLTLIVLAGVIIMPLIIIQIAKRLKAVQDMKAGNKE